jgi:phenylpyruvate tautomerase
MPLIKVQTSVSAPDKSELETMLKSLSAALAKHTGKPESYVMTAFEPDVAMTFAGTTDPVCYIEIKSVGSMSSSQTKSMSQDFCQKINQALGIPQNRIYIEFNDAKGSMWGWNGGTFG